jgi:hypothetical protein
MLNWFFRLFLSFLLGIAALSKLLNLNSSVAEITSLLNLNNAFTYILVYLLIIAELLISLLLIVFFKSIKPIIISLFLFLAFLFYNLIRIVLAGDAECGCFGSALDTKTSTMLILDSIIIMILLYNIKTKGKTNETI